MKTKLTAACILVGALFVPLAGHAEDTDKDRSSASAFVKDSVITTKVKAKLAEEKLSTAFHIRVDTDNKGIVHLAGTAKSQEQIDRAGAVAGGVEGVASVDNQIHLAKGHDAERHSGYVGDHKQMHGSYADKADRVEDRIADMHTRLQITQAQEPQWAKVADAMRDNARQLDALTKSRAERAQMNAVDDLKSYAEISDAHADGVKKFTSAFAPLYDSMSDPQKKHADAVFQHGGRKA